MAVITLTNADFDKIVATYNMVLIDFSASWCAPCRIFGEIYKTASEQHPDILFAEVDIEREQTLAQDFQVRSIPMLVVLKEGIAVYAESGLLNPVQLEELIQRAKALDLQEIRKEIALQKGKDERF